MHPHIALHVFPYVQGLASPKWPDVVTAFQQHAVLEPITNSAAVVLDAGGQFLGGQVGGLFFD